MFSIEKLQPIKSKSKKLTNVKESISASNVLELVAKADAEKEMKMKVKQMKVDEKIKRTESYMRCKAVCICGESICLAGGLKRCDICKDVLKSQCSKSRCKVGTGKPTMTPVYYDVNRKKRKGTDTQPTCSRYLSQDENTEEEKEVGSQDDDVFFEQYYLS